MALSITPQYLVQIGLLVLAHAVGVEHVVEQLEFPALANRAKTGRSVACSSDRRFLLTSWRGNEADVLMVSYDRRVSACEPHARLCAPPKRGTARRPSSVAA